MISKSLVKVSRSAHFQNGMLAIGLETLKYKTKHAKLFIKASKIYHGKKDVGTLYPVVKTN